MRVATEDEFKEMTHRCIKVIDEALEFNNIQRPIAQSAMLVIIFSYFAEQKLSDEKVRFFLNSMCDDFINCRNKIQ